MAKSVQNGSMEMDDFKAKTLDATTASSKFSRMAKTAGTALKSIGATALNMFGGFLIAEGLSLAIKGIYNLINADKIAIENGEKAQQEIKEVFDTYNGKVDTIKTLGKKFAQDADSIKTTGDAVESLTKKYAELRKGVSSDNTNLTLSEKEYQDYLDISNQLAESFPSLVSGSDAAGNSILNLGDNASVAADKMEKLQKTQMTLAHNDIVDKSRDTFRGAFEEADNIEDEIKSLKGQEKQLKESSSQISLSRKEIKEQLKNGHLIFKDMSKTDADKMEKALGAYVGKELGRVRRSDVSLDGHTIDRIEFTIDPVVDENKLNEATDMIEAMVSQPAIMTIDTTGLDETTADTVSKLKEFQEQLNTVNSLEMQQDFGIQVDTNQLDAAKAKAQELFSELQGKSEDGSLEITPDVKVDTGSMESLEQSLSSMTPEIKAKIVPDGNVSDTLVTGDIKVEDQTAKVDYVRGDQEAPADRTASVDYIKKGTTQIEPADKSAAVTYSKIGGEQAPPSDKNANVNYKKGEQEAPSKKNAVVDYKRGSQELPDSPKSATVNYTLGNVATPPDAYVKVHYDTSGKPKGSSPANGTAHSQGSANSGHAFSGGSWGLKQPEKGALINELGAEIIVRNGQWFVENNGYPTITNLKKNDIVFNHEQSKALLERGYVTGSHAKLAYEGNSHAKGTAFSGGSWTFGNTGGGNIGGTNTTSNNLNSASNNLAKAASDTSKAASDTSEAAEKLSEAVSGYTDWVEVLFKRLESQYDLLMSQMERIAHLPDKQQKLYEAMSKNSELLNRTQQAIGTYQSHFDSIVQQSGINPLIVHQIQNGSMDISKYDQDTQKIISELQSYYDKLVDCNKQYDDLLNKQSELAQTALDNIEDYIDMMTGIESSAVDYQEALRELAAAKGESAYSDNMYGSLQESIKNQQDVAGKLQSQIKSYQDEINKLMANGYMAEYSTEWFEAQAALNGFRQEAAEAEKTLIELQDQLRELDLLKLQQVIDELDRTAKRLENNSDLTESKGEQVSEKDLQAQLDNANAQIQANYDKRNELLKDQAKYDVGSDKYNEIAEEIEKLDDAIFDAMENIEDLKNKIWEVRWQPFFDGQEALGDLIDQTDDLRGLLNSDAFLDKNGGLTVDGIANLSLISQGMNAAKQQIKNYQEALKKLDEDLKNGNISTSEYKEQQKEFLNQISSSVGVVEDYKDSIVDLYTKMLEQENEVAQKSIDKQKELLDIKKKNADYNKTLRKQARDVNTLKAQISALEGVKLFARLLFNSGKVPTTLSCYNGTGNGKRECGTSL